MPYVKRLISAVLISCLAPLIALAQAPAPPPVPATPATPPAAPPLLNSSDGRTVSRRRHHQGPPHGADRRLDRAGCRHAQPEVQAGSAIITRTPAYRIRLQLKLEGLGDTGSTMLQVCDGKILWDYQKVLKMQQYRKKEITPILKKLEDPNLDAQFRGLVIANMGFGGPEAMLSGLRKVGQVRPDPRGKARGGWRHGRRGSALAGTWRDRTGLLDLNDRPLAPTAPVAPYVPSNVRVFIGKTNGWPYKIEMIGNAPTIAAPNSIPGRSTPPPAGRSASRGSRPRSFPAKITLAYKAASRSRRSPTRSSSSPLRPTCPATSVKDETEEFPRPARPVYPDDETNRKKAEAAKAEGEALAEAHRSTSNRPDPATALNRSAQCRRQTIDRAAQVIGWTGRPLTNEKRPSRGQSSGGRSFFH